MLIQKGLSDETIKLPSTSNNSLYPLIDNKLRGEFNGGWLKQQNKLLCYNKTTVNIYGFYELGASGSFSYDAKTKKLLVWCS